MISLQLFTARRVGAVWARPFTRLRDTACTRATNQDRGPERENMAMNMAEPGAQQDTNETANGLLTAMPPDTRHAHQRRHAGGAAPPSRP